MKKLFLFISILIAVPAYADLSSTTPNGFAVSFSAQANTSGTRYINPINGSVLSATNSDVYALIPGSNGAAAGTVLNMWVATDVAPGAGTGYVITFRTGAKASPSLPATYITCSIKNSEQTCTDLYTSYGHSASLTSWNFMEYEIRPFNTPAAARFTIWIDYLPATAGYTIIAGSANNSNIGATGPDFGFISGTAATSTTESTRYSTLMAGTFHDLCANLTTAPGAGNGRLLQYRVNVVTQTNPQVNFTDTDVNTECDNSNTLHVANGDRVNMQWTETTPTSSLGRWSAFFAPDTSGDFPILSTTGGSTLSTSSGTPNWTGLGGTTTGTSSELAFQQVLPGDMTIIAAVGLISGSAGSAPRKYNTVLREATVGGTPANASVTFAMGLDGTTAKTASGTFTPTSGDLYDTQYTADDSGGAPNAQRATVTYTGHRGSTTYATPSCNDLYIIADWSGGVDAAVVASAALYASTFGADRGVPWTVSNPGTSLTFSTSADTPFTGSPTTACVLAWPGDTATVGVKLAADNNFRYNQYTFDGRVGVTNRLSIGLPFWSDYDPTRANINMDVADIHAKTANYLNFALQSGGANLRITMEIKGSGNTMSGGTCPYSDVNYNGPEVSTVQSGNAAGVYYTARMPYLGDGYGIRGRFYAYNHTTGAIGAQLLSFPTSDDDSALPCDIADPLESGWTKHGHVAVSSAGNDTPSGSNNYYGPLLVCLDGRFPCLPSSFNATGGTGDFLLRGVK